MATEHYGLIFGGETRDAFGIGVYQALAEKHIPTDYAIGAAFGAYNAALVCAGNLDAADVFWNDGLADKLIRLNNEIAVKSLGEWMTLSHAAFRRAYLHYVFNDHKTLYQALTTCIDEDAVRRSPIRFGLSTVNEKTLMPVSWMIDDIPHGKLARTLMISATIPVYRQDPEGFNYLENGLYERMPTRLAFKQDTNDWLGADLSEKGLTIKARKKGKVLTPIEHSELVIASQHEARILGQLDTLKVLGFLQGEDYYLDPAEQHVFFDRSIRTVGELSADKQIATVQATLLNLSPDASQIDALTAIMALLSQTKYQKAENKMLAFLEITAKTLGIPRLQRLSVDDLILKILDAFESSDNPKSARLTAVIKKIMANPNTADASALTPEERLSIVTIFTIAKTAADIRRSH